MSAPRSLNEIKYPCKHARSVQRTIHEKFNSTRWADLYGSHSKEPLLPSNDVGSSNAIIYTSSCPEDTELNSGINGQMKSVRNPKLNFEQEKKLIKREPIIDGKNRVRSVLVGTDSSVF